MYRVAISKSVYAPTALSFLEKQSYPSTLRYP